jgi:thiosulfate/3-mercaptopyruvate sulfurtransferase
MKTAQRGLFGAALVLASAVVAYAQTPAPLLVDVAWLTQHLNDRDVVVLHIGREYATRHIPGARELTGEPTVAGLAALGVSDSSRIVVYSTGEEIPAMQMFAFDALGFGERVSLLNGGLIGWTAAGRPVTAEAPRVTPGKLTPPAPKDLIVDAEFVKSLASRPSHRLVDARAPVYFQGIEGMHGKAGHIPGAVNIPFTELGTNKTGIDRERLAKVFADAGIKPGDTVVAYCHIGQQGRWLLLGARILGHPVRLYQGSFHDWTSNDRGPVVK